MTRHLLAATILVCALTQVSAQEDAFQGMYRFQLSSPITFAGGSDSGGSFQSQVVLPATSLLRANASISLQPTLSPPASGVSWSTDPELPDFLNINPATGLISGTVPTPNDYGTFAVQATLDGTTRHADLDLVIAAQAIAAGSVPSLTLTVGDQVNLTVPHTGGEGTRSYEWVDENLVPAWLALSESDGTITGTAEAGTSTGLSVRITDTSGDDVTDPFDVTVSAAAMPSFTNLTNQVTKSVVLSDIVAASGGAASASSTGPSESFRVCADPACASVTTNWTTATTLPSGQKYLQLRQTASASPNIVGTATLTIGSYSTSWTIRTAPAMLLTAGGSIGYRDGFSVRCGSWNGSTCRDLQIRPDTGNGWWAQSTGYNGDIAQGEWYSSWWSSSGVPEASFFCYLATGNTGHTGLLRTSITNNPAPIGKYVVGSTSFTAPYRIGQHAGYGTSDPLVMTYSNLGRRLDVRCNGW